MRRGIWVIGAMLIFVFSAVVSASHLPQEEKDLGTDYVRLSGCVPGHGFHWAKNPAKFGPPGSENNPILLYHRGRLAGAEYVMPASIAEKEPPREARRGPELSIGKNLHKGEFAIRHIDLEYTPVHPPDKKDGIKAFTVHLWSVEHSEHEAFCK